MLKRLNLDQQVFKTLNSRTVILTVCNQFKKDMFLIDLRIRAQPRNSIIKEGKSVVFVCQAAGTVSE